MFEILEIISNNTRLDTTSNKAVNVGQRFIKNAYAKDLNVLKINVYLLNLILIKIISLIMIVYVIGGKLYSPK